MRWTAAFILSAALSAPSAIGASGTTRVAHNYAERIGHAWVQRAIETAAARLALAECQKVFTDFVTADRVPLSRVLAELKTTPEDYLTQGIWFMEGDREPQCRGRDIAAFTEKGSRVIYVCSSRVTAQYITDGDLIVIHEMLHSLGLGENPPTSAQITKAVWARCR